MSSRRAARALAICSAACATLGALAGAHAFGAFSAQATNTGNVIATRPDFKPPQVVRAAIAKTTGFDPDWVRQGGQYYVYAQIADSGNPPSGIATVTANVASLTSGQTAVTLVAGSYTVGGQTYNYRSAALTAQNPLAAGVYSFSIATTDNAGNAGTFGPYTVNVDNTAPQGVDVQTQNGGATACRPESGDTVTFTYSEPIDPQSILAGWDGSPTTVTVRIVNTLFVNDRLTVWNAANTAQLPVANPLSLGRTDYVGANRNFNNSTMQRTGNTIVVTLGTPSGGVNTAGGNGNMTWTVPAGAYDRAGNAIATGNVNESGAADCEF